MQNNELLQQAHLMFMQQQNQQYVAGAPDMPKMPYANNGQMRQQQ